MIPDPEKIPGIKNSRNSQKKDVFLIGARHFRMNCYSVAEYPETLLISGQANANIERA
jgi:hypothetical protein